MKKIATGLSEKGLSVLLEENNKVGKVQLDRISDAWKVQLDSKLDITSDEPIFHYEIAARETKKGVPHLISLDGVEFFNWVDCEDE